MQQPDHGPLPTPSLALSAPPVILTEPDENKLSPLMTSPGAPALSSPHDDSLPQSPDGWGADKNELESYCKERLLAHSELVDTDLERAAAVLTDVKKVILTASDSSEPPALLLQARVLGAEALQHYAAAAAAANARPWPDCSAALDVRQAARALELALRACRLTEEALGALQSMQSEQRKQSEQSEQSEQSLRKYARERATILLVRASVLLTAAQATGGIEFSDSDAVADSAVQCSWSASSSEVIRQAIECCYEYSDAFCEAQIDMAHWNDPWLPFIKLMMLKLYEEPDAPPPRLVAEFKDAVRRAKEMLVAALEVADTPAAGPPVQKHLMELLDLFMVETVALQATGDIAAARAAAQAGVDVGQRACVAAADPPLVQRSVAELEQLLASI